jgi:hypothetical protein
VQTRNELVAVDPVDLKILVRFPLQGARHPHGLFVAPTDAIGYVASDENDLLQTIDLQSGKILSQLPLGHDPDVLDADIDRKRLYVASESGVLASFDISDPAKPVPLAHRMVGENAHSIAVDPLTHRLLLPLANNRGAAVLREIEAD